MMLDVLESHAHADIHHSGEGHIDDIGILESRHTSQVKGCEELFVVCTHAEDRDVHRSSDSRMFALGIGFRPSVDIESKSKPGIEVDIRMMVIGETHRRHDDQVEEMLVLVSSDFCARSVSYHVVPLNAATIDHTAEGHPILKAIMILDPYMLAVDEVLFVGLLPGGRHRSNDSSGFMPHQGLKELVSPTHTNLMRPIDHAPTILCSHSAAEAAEGEKDKYNSFHHNWVQKYNFFLVYANIFVLFLPIWQIFM